MQTFRPVIALPYLRPTLLFACLLAIRPTTAFGQTADGGPTTGSGPVGGASVTLSPERQRADLYFTKATTHFQDGEFAQAAVNAHRAFEIHRLPQYLLGYGRAMQSYGCVVEAIDAFSGFLGSGSGTPSQNRDTKHRLVKLRAGGQGADPQECKLLAEGRLPAEVAPPAPGPGAVESGQPGAMGVNGSGDESSIIEATTPVAPVGDRSAGSDTGRILATVLLGAGAAGFAVAGGFVLDTGVSSLRRAERYAERHLGSACLQEGLCGADERAAVESYKQKHRKGVWHTTGGVALLATSVVAALVIVPVWSSDDSDDSELAGFDAQLGFGAIQFRTTF